MPVLNPFMMAPEALPKTPPCSVERVNLAYFSIKSLASLSTAPPRLSFMKAPIVGSFSLLKYPINRLITLGPYSNNKGATQPAIEDQSSRATNSSNFFFDNRSLLI